MSKESLAEKTSHSEAEMGSKRRIRKPRKLISSSSSCGSDDESNHVQGTNFDKYFEKENAQPNTNRNLIHKRDDLKQPSPTQNSEYSSGMYNIYLLLHYLLYCFYYIFHLLYKKKILH